MQIGFIGAGNMATALARGWGEPVLVHDAYRPRAEALVAELGGEVLASNAELAARVDAVLLAHKPPGLERVAARIDITARACGATSSATDRSCAGLWHRTTRSARWASSAFVSTATPPTSSASARARSMSMSVHRTGRRHPSASPRAMAPDPIRPILTA